MTEFRIATVHDAPLIAQLAAKTFTDTFGHLYDPDDLTGHLAKTCSEEFFIRAIREENDIVILATHEGATVGYAKVGKLGVPVKTPPKRSREIHRVYVLKDFQRSGLGSEIMRYIFDLPLIRNAEAVYLSVWEHNYPAQKFYARYGFKPVGKYMYYVGRHADREIILRRDRPT